MGLLSTEQKNLALTSLAVLLREKSAVLMEANSKDLEEQKGVLPMPLFQRLKLDNLKIEALVEGCHDLIQLPDPVGKILLSHPLQPNLLLERVSVPLGVLAVIFESRPDVIPQILALSLKSGNSVILKAGREARNTVGAFRELIDELSKRCEFLPNQWCLVLDSREEVRELLEMDDLIDLVIPRGSNEMVREIQKSTHIPVMGHAEGVCHMYIHSPCDIKMAVDLAVNAKAQYPSACNALETLLIDVGISEIFLPHFADVAELVGIQLRGCEESRRILPQIERAIEEDWRAEYGDLRLAIRVVSGLNDAITHINEYGSHHTDSIVTSDKAAAEIFLSAVDSACVFHNVSTRFADGFRFGFGAEVGISTSKLHARGPVGLDGLVSYKYKLRGGGHTVS
jgi:glutamate-5-semialdehyde dehydrogenase